MDFKTLTDTIFSGKRNWYLVSNEDKESLFFIFNRYMSKHHPKQAQFFNDKNIDKVIAMDIWFEFLKKENRVPFWYWKGPTKRKSNLIKGSEIILDFYTNMKTNELDSLCLLFPKDVKEEIKRLEEIRKEQNA